MGAFLYGVLVRWKLDLRNRALLTTFYIYPLLIFAFMSGILLTIDASYTDTLIQRMTVFSVSIGALIGCPIPLVKTYGSNIKKVYKTGGIPIWVPTLTNFVTSFINLYIVSLIIFFISPAAFNAKLPSNIPVYFAHLTIFIIASITVGTVIGLIVKSTSKLAIISQFVFIPSIMLSGIILPTSMLPKVLLFCGQILPATSGFAAMIKDHFDFLTVAPMLDDILILGLIICGTALAKMNKKTSDK